MSNAFNVNNYIGRIPSTDKLPFNFIEKDDPTKNFMSFMISVRRAYKAKDAKYAEEDLIPVKIFGHGATYVHNYINRGDTVAVAGELRRDDDWTDKDGETHRGQLCVYADSVRGIGGGKKSDNESDDSGETTEAPKKTGRAALRDRVRNRNTQSRI